MAAKGGVSSSTDTSAVEGAGRDHWKDAGGAGASGWKDLSETRDFHLRFLDPGNL